MRVGLGVRHKYRAFICIFVCMTVLVCFVLKRLEPVYDLQLEGYANSLMNDIVNNAVNDVFGSGDYNSLTSSEQGNGQTTAFEADTARINRLKSQLLVNIQEKINSNSAKTVHLPLMSMSGFHVLSGFGPEIPVKISPSSLVNSDFEESFYSAGINQVIHKLTLEITASVAYSGFMYSKRENVSVKIPILETVISGETPKYYGGNMTPIPESN